MNSNDLETLYINYIEVRKELNKRENDFYRSLENKISGVKE